jgi:hypothetical protein
LSAYTKPALVLIISVLLFAGLFFLLDSEPLDYVRTHFYNPSFVNSIVKENEKAAEIVQSHILELQNRFADTLNEPAVKSSFLYNQAAADIYERSRVFGILVESVSGLQSVQFVDSNGVRIHYSTSTRDVISQSSNSATYRNYTDDSRALPYNDISAGANENPKYTMDDSHDRIIFSFPFYDSMDVYRGTAFFTLSVRALAERLITEGSLKPTDDVSVIRTPRGVVFGSPNMSKSVILEQISSAWSAGLREYITLDAEDAGVKYALVSTKAGNDLFFGRIINDSIFSVPESMKLILQLSMFLTLFLTLYFIINFKPHPVTLVQNRIKTLRSTLFEQLYIKKTGPDRLKWILELEQRRDEIRFELKSRIRVKHSLDNKIDGIIDKAWDELLAVMKSGYDLASLEEIVKSRTVKIEKPKAGEPEEIEEAEEVYDVQEFEEIEEVEEIDDEEIENIDDDDIEEIGEIEEVGEIEEIKSYTEIQLSKGLLKAASEVFVKLKKEEAKASARKGKGLLKHAVEYLNSKETASSPVRGKGLLRLAIEFLKSIESKGAKETDAVEEIEALEEGKPAPRGLLALASTYIKKFKSKPEARIAVRPPVQHAALSTENFSVREIDEDNSSEAEENGQELSFEMEVVSPFSSMFSSLEDEKESVTSSMSAD